MTWSLMQLAKPLSSAAGLSGGVSVLSADPFMHGVAEVVNGRSLLSFPNAVKSLSNRVAGNKAALAVGFAGENIPHLMSQLSAFNAACPLPYFSRLKRRAEKMITLESDKFDLVPFSVSSAALQLTGLPSVKALFKTDTLQAAIDDVSSYAFTNPVTLLDDFETEKTAYDASVSSLISDAGAELTGNHGWLFYAENNVASGLLSGHPGHEFTQSAVLLFEGEPEELAYLTELFKPV